MHVMIVDDEAPARSELRYLLEETGEITAITEASAARDAVEKLIGLNGTVDAVFLDISMPKVSGVDLARAFRGLKNPPVVVFVTAYTEYAVDAFDLEAIDYLVKPVEPERLQRALEKIRSHLRLGSQKQTCGERVPVVKGGRKLMVPVEQIRYIKAKDDYSCIYTEGDRFLSALSLLKFEQKLSKFGFFRVHRAYIVNLSFVESTETISPGVIQLKMKGDDEVKISVSRRRTAALRQALEALGVE